MTRVPSSTLFNTVLVANRGEIAVRVMRTCRRLGSRTVAVYSDADAGSRHVREADIAVHIGRASAQQSYLNIDRVIAAAKATGAQAIHPGYGFLSENTDFARACESAGIVFLGPSAAAIEVMGDKIAAKATVAGYGVPLVPGVSRPNLSDAELIEGAADIGFPVLVKPSAGGGGKGMREVERAEDLPAALASARRESASSFGDDTLFLERLIRNPRHIEVQILADSHGNVVHLGERECSLQRRHQKVIEEAPSPLLDEAARQRIGEAACNTARSVGYTGAGTVEFIVSADQPDEFFFMEMNTRLQVEHPVTEEVTGLDLVEQQLLIGAGAELTFGQADVRMTGHAIEARIYAEDPARDFLPTGGIAIDIAEPENARVDSGLLAGQRIGTDYDPMLAKVITHGASRAEALQRLDAALGHLSVPGVVTNIDFLRFLINDPQVQAGELDTGLIDRRMPDYVPASAPAEVWAVAALYRQLALVAEARSRPGNSLWDHPSGWRVGEHAPVRCEFAVGDDSRRATLWPDDPARDIAGVHDDGIITARGRIEVATGAHGDDVPDGFFASASMSGQKLDAVLDGARQHFQVWPDGDDLWISTGQGTFALKAPRRAASGEGAGTAGDDVLSPMPGTIIDIPVGNGEQVVAGQPIVIVEAMKMEHVLTAPADGVVTLRVRAGQQVALDEVLASVETPAMDSIPNDIPSDQKAATS
ncbi:acetyl/propionyl/methylcrotonyl-CoA carboxylase subunit alpha [Saxibacter everestensis]|uniref:biotin carboxylase n=1 Tax=Saxibacter everestensis TaxID=2909229 RepID=A0ABY8QRH3_9MICO|nr:acetyl/propionyl/methylcrotonyl-CoA carboxylase subunit alpha [Brevibacteriaceae bacterium ZFBP1038]